MSTINLTKMSELEIEKMVREESSIDLVDFLESEPQENQVKKVWFLALKAGWWAGILSIEKNLSDKMPFDEWLDEEGRHVSHFIASGAGEWESVQLLNKYGKLDIKDNDGDIPLAFIKHARCLTLWSQRVFSHHFLNLIRTKNKSGQTVFMLWAKNESWPLVCWALQNGYKVESDEHAFCVERFESAPLDWKKSFGSFGFNT
jgi:hypothetical protein